ncbi:MAG: polysaccharide deacetylase family protein [Solirubrobacteraceae bacterium]
MSPDTLPQPCTAVADTLSRVAIAERRTLILSVDFEDWNQLVARRVGATRWDRRGPALERQTATLLDELDAIGARATFFLLGLTARRYPDLVGEIAARGHELASHGFAHRRVHEQTPEELRRDVSDSLELIDAQTGRRARGYRAPAFSITRSTPWAYDVLAELGMEYDSSQYDTPRIPDRIRPVPPAPVRMELASGRTLWELPVAVWRPGAGRALPIGGGAYWRALPRAVLLHGLASAAAQGLQALYLHPYECDPRPLRACLERDEPRAARLQARLREAQRNPRRARVRSHLRAVGHHFRLVTCQEAIDGLKRDRATGTAPLPRTRALL